MFEVGKKVICIKDHSEGIVRKGQVYPINAIKKGHCVCGYKLIDIGKPFHTPQTTLYNSMCMQCGHQKVERNDGIQWLSCILFAPYDDSLSEHTADSLLEELTTRPLTPAEMHFHKTMLAHYEQRCKDMPDNYFLKGCYRQHKRAVQSGTVLTIQP